MTKANKDRASVKVTPELLGKLKAEAFQRFESTGREPTYGELLEEMWTKAKAKTAEVVNTAIPPEPSDGVPPAYAVRDLGNKKLETDNRNPTYSGNTESAQAHALLELIHRSGHRIAIDAILANLHAFFVLVCSDVQGRKREITEIPADIAAEFPDIARDYAEAMVPKDDVGGAGGGAPGRHRKRPDRRAG